MKKVAIGVLGLVVGLSFIGVAQAIGNNNFQGVIPRVFGHAVLADSPADVTTMSNAAAARTASDLPSYALVRLLCTEDAYYKMGDSSVTAAAGDTFLPKKTVVVESMGPTSSATRVSFILDSAASGRCQAKLMR